MGEKKEPNLEERVIISSASGVSFLDEFSNVLDTMPVPIKEDKPDVLTFIEGVRSKASELAQKYLGDNPQYNHRIIPGYDTIKSQLETVPGAIENDRLTRRGKDAIIAVFNTQIENLIVEERGMGSYQAEPVEKGKPSGNNLADVTSNKYLRPLIESAKTGAELAARLRTAISDAYTKARQWYQTHKNMDGFREAYAFK